MFVVCSDEARNGKTLTARLLMDHLLVPAATPMCSIAMSHAAA